MKFFVNNKNTKILLQKRVEMIYFVKSLNNACNEGKVYVYTLKNKKCFDIINIIKQV